MSKPTKMNKATGKARNYNYPANTAGAWLAGKLRSEANNLSDEKRCALFKQGMRVIYGG